mmetsp:Transcript_85225/g.241487  ORF Transcript_85225/g.241487 Transcript_85225/m.241487 type:complete len:238 (+) Transcript_85225:1926-2639(+)
MSGMMFTESLKQAARLNGGDSMKTFPSSWPTTLRTRRFKKFSRTDLMTSICSKAVSLVAHPLGNGVAYISSLVSRAFHSLLFAMSSRRPVKEVPPLASVSFSRTPSLLQAGGAIQLGQGCACRSSSETTPTPASGPRRKKSHSAGGSGVLPRNAQCVSFFRIWAVTRKEKSILWSSKRPRQMFTYMYSVKSSIRMPIRRSITSLFSESRSRPWKRSTKNSRLYWYMGSTFARSATTK